MPRYRIKSRGQYRSIRNYACPYSHPYSHSTTEMKLRLSIFTTHTRYNYVSHPILLDIKMGISIFLNSPWTPVEQAVNKTRHDLSHLPHTYFDSNVQNT